MPNILDNVKTRTQFASASIKQWLQISSALRNQLSKNNQSKEAIVLFELIFGDSKDNILPKIYFNRTSKLHDLQKNVVDFYQDNFCFPGPESKHTFARKLELENALISYIKHLKENSFIDGAGLDKIYPITFLIFISNALGLNHFFSNSDIPEEMALAISDFLKQKSRSDTSSYQQPNILDVYFLINNEIQSKIWSKELDDLVLKQYNSFCEIKENEKQDLILSNELDDIIRKKLQGDELQLYLAFICDKPFSAIQLNNIGLCDKSIKTVQLGITEHLGINPNNENLILVSRWSIHDLAAKKRIGLFSKI